MAVSKVFLASLVAAAVATNNVQSGDLRKWLQELDPANELPEKFSVPEFRHNLIKRLSAGALLDLSAAGLTEDVFVGSEYPYFNFIPQYSASLIPGKLPVKWQNGCFASNIGSVKKNADGTFALTITSSSPASVTCSDNYKLMTVSGSEDISISQTGKTEITWTLPADALESEIWDIEAKGVRVFSFLNDNVTNAANLLKTGSILLPMFTQHVPKGAAERNVDFLRDYAHFDMQPIDPSENTYVPEHQIHSGDFFGVLRLDGLDPMLGWAMGSTTGHTTTALWIDGELFVTESTVLDSYWPKDGVQRTPYKTWLKQAHAAGFNVVHVPLNEEARAKFDEAAAVEWFVSVEGLEYGYHTMFWGWLDTLDENYPCLPPTFDGQSGCLGWEFLEPAFALLDKAEPALADTFWIQAFNFRLGTEGLRTADLYYEAYKQGMDSKALPTIVEQDSWMYDTTMNGEPAVGRSMVCCVYVCSLWKAAGVFEDFGSEVNCGEMTNWDDYALTIFEPSYVQILGDYGLVLNDFNTKDPYAGMAEHCPSQAPDYEKPSDC